MSLITFCNAALAEIGLPTLTTLFGNPDANAALCIALANRAGRELAEDASAAGYWQFLRKQYVFQTTGVGPYTCTITPGSLVLTNVSSTAGIQIGYNVYASGLLNDTLVTGVNVAGANTVSISIGPNATIALSGQSVTFAQEAYPFPSDLAYLIVQTEWDRNFRWQLLGPLDAQEWQVIKSGISPVGPRMRFRIMQGMFYINPVGSATSVYNDNIVFEYVSNQWISQDGFTGSANVFSSDNQFSLINEDLLTMSVKWRFLKAKGLDWESDEAEYKAKKDKATGRSASSRSLPLNSRASGLRLLNAQNVPDTNFGS